MLCVRICVYTYICVCTCAFNPHPWVRLGLFINARSPKCSSKAISMNHSTTIAHCWFGPLGYAEFLGLHFCPPPSRSTHWTHNHISCMEKHSVKKYLYHMDIQTTSHIRSHVPTRLHAPLAFISFLFFFFSFLSCIRTRLHLWLAGCELSAH